jgi:hypothetical protein
MANNSEDLAMNEQDIEKLVQDKIKSAGYGFDPLTIIAIVSLAIQLYKLLKECRATKKNLVAAAKRQGFAYRFFVQNNYYNKMQELNIPKDQADALLEELRLAFIADMES